MAGGRAAGGSLALVELIRDYGDELEADLAHYYGTDLRDAFRRAPAQPVHPIRRAGAHRLAPYWLGTAGALLLAILIFAPIVGAAMVASLLLTGPVAWYELTPDEPDAGHALTPRRVLALVRHLPHDSATVAAIRGGAQYRGWTADRYLLALLGDLLQNLIYVQVARANPKRRPTRPSPIPRPGEGEQSSGKPNTFAVIAHEHLRKARNARGGTRGTDRR